MLSSGILTGGILTINSVDASKFDLTAGTGFILDNYTDPSNPVYLPVSWSNFTGVIDTEINTSDTTYLFIDETGSIIQRGDLPPEGSDRRQLIILGWLDHTQRGPNIEFALTEPDPPTDLRAQMSDFFIDYGSFNVWGNDISPNGANLKIDRSEGVIFEVGSNWLNDKTNPS